MQTIDLPSLPPDERLAASAAAWSEINAHDAEDRAALEALVPPTGWFTIPLYGKPASDAAWSIVQHQTGDVAFMAAMLARMEEPAHLHEVDPHDYALLVDRVAMLQDREQVYGSQFVCTDHLWTLCKLERPNEVDERRRALGLDQTEEQVAAQIATCPPCFS